jgi:hypothetical protein
MSAGGTPTAAMALRIAVFLAALSDPAAVGVGPRVSTETMMLARSAGTMRSPSPLTVISGPRAPGVEGPSCARAAPPGASHAASTNTTNRRSMMSSG